MEGELRSPSGLGEGRSGSGRLPRREAITQKEQTNSSLVLCDRERELMPGQSPLLFLEETAIPAGRSLGAERASRGQS